MRSLFGLGVTFVVIIAAAAAPSSSPKKVRPTPLEVNTKADEDEPHFLGNRLFYSSNAGGKFGLLLSTRQSPVAPWTKGKPVEGIETEGDDRGCFFVTQKDGFQYLFFSS